MSDPNAASNMSAMSPIAGNDSRTPSQFDPHNSVMNATHNRGAGGGVAYSVCNESGNYDLAVANTSARLNMSRKIASKTVVAASLGELDEDPRYGIWHPRYYY